MVFLQRFELFFPISFHLSVTILCIYKFFMVIAVSYTHLRAHETPDFLGGEEHLAPDGINHLLQLIPMSACRLDSWMALH